MMPKKMPTKTYMAIDQYGQKEHDLGPYPRKELLERCGRQHAAKMYRGYRDGSAYHVGYVISGRWFTLYEVIPFKKAV